MPTREELDKLFQKSFESHKPTMFIELLPPEGVLNTDAACHALWHYASIVRGRIEAKSGPQYDDDIIDLMNVYDLQKVFTSIALLYKTTPEKMIKFWKNVDLQMRLMKSNPIEAKYRFDKVPEIKTQ